MDTPAYKAFRIVLINWIKPSIKARKLKASTKIARWWIRISGSYRGFKLYRPYLPMNESFPPGIWRQTNSCMYSYNRSHIIKNLTSCPHYHLRWIKQKLKNSINTLQIKKYDDENGKVSFKFDEIIFKFKPESIPSFSISVRTYPFICVLS